MRIYKIWYVLGLMFMGIFFLGSMSTGLQPIYILLSLICFLISGKYYKDSD